MNKKYFILNKFTFTNNCKGKHFHPIRAHVSIEAFFYRRPLLGSLYTIQSLTYNYIIVKTCNIHNVHQQ